MIFNDTETLSAMERARRYIGTIPPAITGQGGDEQTFVVACVLVQRFSLSESEALELMHEYNTRCVPPWSDTQLLRKIRLAGRATGPAPSAMPPAGRRKAAVPCIDPATTVERWLKGFRCTEQDLFNASPVKPPREFRDTVWRFLVNMYEGDDKVNIVFEYSPSPDGRKATPRGRGLTLLRDDWWGPANRQSLVSDSGCWVRMNPLDGQGIGDANVTACRYGLLEFDSIPLELQLPLIAKLKLPVAAIVASGGRSYHAWLLIDAVTADAYRKEMREVFGALDWAGADQKNVNPARLARLPGVRRRIGASGDGMQRLIYCYPSKADLLPIFSGLSTAPRTAEHPWSPGLVISGCVVDWPAIDRNAEPSEA